MKPYFVRSRVVTIPSLGVVAFSLSACKWISSDSERAGEDPISTKVLYTKKETNDFLDDVGDFTDIPAMTLNAEASGRGERAYNREFDAEIARLLSQAKAEVDQFGPEDISDPEEGTAPAQEVTSSKVEALRSISRFEFLSEQGDHQSSVKQAQALIVAGISDVTSQVRELTTLAREQHAYGDGDGAKETMSIARERSRSASEADMSEVYALMVIGYTAVGDTASGREFATMIKDGARRAEMLTDVAEAAAGRGDNSLVKELERSIPEGEGKDWTLYRMVNAQLRGGDFAAAEQSASQIDSTSEAAVWSYLALAEEAVGRGESAKYQKIVVSVKEMLTASGADSEEKRVLQVRARQALSVLQQRAGQTDESSQNLKQAVATARSVSSRGLRDSLLLFLVRGYLDIGDLAGANAALPLATSPKERIQGLRSIAGAAHQAADHAGYANAVAEMKEIANNIPGVEHQNVAFALSQVALTQIEAGDLDGGERTTSKSIPGHWKDKALLAMTRAHANKGDVEEARRVARKITTSHTSSLAMQEVARSQLRAGDLDGAEETAKAIEKLGLQTAMLAEVAENRSPDGISHGDFLDPFQPELPEFKRTAAVTRLGRGELKEAQIGEAVASVKDLGNARDRCYGYLAIADILMNG